MGTIFNIVFGKVQSTLIAIGAAIAFIVGVFFYGRQVEKTKQRVKDLEDFKETTDAINSVDTNLDRKSRVKRLRKNGVIR